MLRKLDDACETAPVAVCRHGEGRDLDPELLERCQHRGRGGLRFEIHLELAAVRPVAHAARHDPQRPETHERDHGRDHGRPVEAGPARHADRGHEPQRRRRRQAADREALADDRAGADEADAGDDLRRDARRIERDAARLRKREVAPGVRGDEREQRRSHGDEHVRAEARFPLAQLALDADDAAERGRRGEPYEDLPGGEIRHARCRLRDPARRESARSRPLRARAARRARPARTAPARPSPGRRRMRRRRS